jgi:hypothetical protein
MKSPINNGFGNAQAFNMPWTDKLPVILSLNDCFKGRQDNNFKVIAAFARFALLFDGTQFHFCCKQIVTRRVG